MTFRNVFIPMPVSGKSLMAYSARDQSSVRPVRPVAIPGPDWLIATVIIRSQPRTVAATPTASTTLTAIRRVRRPYHTRKATAPPNNPPAPPRDFLHPTGHNVVPTQQH